MLCEIAIFLGFYLAFGLTFILLVWIMVKVMGSLE